LPYYLLNLCEKTNNFSHTRQSPAGNGHTPKNKSLPAGPWLHGTGEKVKKAALPAYLLNKSGRNRLISAAFASERLVINLQISHLLFQFL
jgi:hypothetical protein